MSVANMGLAVPPGLHSGAVIGYTYVNISKILQHRILPDTENIRFDIQVKQTRSCFVMLKTVE